MLSQTGGGNAPVSTSGIVYDGAWITPTSYNHEVVNLGASTRCIQTGFGLRRAVDLEQAISFSTVTPLIFTPRRTLKFGQVNYPLLR